MSTFHFPFSISHSKSGGLLFALLCSAPLAAQPPVTLEQCRARAQAAYPLARQRGLVEKALALSVANLNRGYLPQVSLAAKASYQSDVTQIPIDFSQVPMLSSVSIPSLSKDQYSATLEVTQSVWDGGAISAQKTTARAASALEARQLEAELYALNEKVNQLYFGVLLVDEQLRQSDLLAEELRRSYDQTVSYAENGIAGRADVDAVRVEQLNVSQRQAQLRGSRRAYCEMLAALTSLPDSAFASLAKTSGDLPLRLQPDSLPSLLLLDAQSRHLDAQKENIKAASLPKLGLFVQGGYGKPGLDMLSNEFAPFYVAGARLQWSFGSLYTQANERKKIEVRKSAVALQADVYKLNLDLQKARLAETIQSLRDMMKMDSDIIALRESVKKAAEAKVANGTLSVTELLREVTAESLARQVRALHEVELMMAVAEYAQLLNGGS
ncbi:MAG: TolC family protein [Prevotellaceae bacterium]|jgi:outer membrane protein TolC|nr:TolC family protein [Prevotellaceae bacterium]